MFFDDLTQTYNEDLRNLMSSVTTLAERQEVLALEMKEINEKLNKNYSNTIKKQMELNKHLEKIPEKLDQNKSQVMRKLEKVLGLVKRY